MEKKRIQTNGSIYLIQVLGNNSSIDPNVHFKVPFWSETQSQKTPYSLCRVIIVMEPQENQKEAQKTADKKTFQSDLLNNGTHRATEYMKRKSLSGEPGFLP